jgi:Peptidase family M48
VRSILILTAAVVPALMPSATIAQQPASPSEVIAKIAAQEQAEMQLLRQYSPMVETYIQYLRPDKPSGAVPGGDKYFLGRAELAGGLELEPLERTAGVKRKLFASLGQFFTTEFVPRGFLQMIYLDTRGFDRAHYKIEYLRREFLGEVRCLVFDVDPIKKSDEGRFVGRIWVEDQDFHIVRFNGAYGGASLTSNYFNFDSWRVNAGKNLWLPALIYNEEGNLNDQQTRNIRFKPFRAQTRLWGYKLGQAHQEQELSKVLVEAPTGVKDQSEAANDYSPMQAERSWGRQAEDNVIDRLERQGLLAPYGEVDKVLETVVNNLEVTNNLTFEPPVRCRVLMISTLESFTVGHTIVLSRGLIDVLPDETSLAAILAHELGHVALGHRMNTQFGFFDSLQFDEKETFRHFDFARTPEEEQAANQRGVTLLRNSPYKSYDTTRLFFQALKNRSKEIPNLISPSLGDRVATSWTITPAPSSAGFDNKPTDKVIAALPLGGRIKVDPWNNQLRLLKSKPLEAVSEGEKMPFQITPFLLYLTRQADNPPLEAADAAKLPSGTKP